MKQYHKIIFIILFPLLLIFTLNIELRAQKSGSGVGVIIGEPIGLSGKFWNSPSTAIDVGIAWSFIDQGSFHIHGDYLWHSFDIFKTTQPIALYYGAGARMKASSPGGARFGIRGVVGLDYFTPSAPVDIFIEAAPIMDLTPATKLTFNGGLGFRFFFK